MVRKVRPCKKWWARRVRERSCKLQNTRGLRVEAVCEDCKPWPLAEFSSTAKGSKELRDLTHSSDSRGPPGLSTLILEH